MRTGFVWHELYMWHDNNGTAAGVLPPGKIVQPHYHLENAETKRRIRNLLDVCGVLDGLVPVKPRPVTDAEILRAHTERYLAHLVALNETGGEAGPLTGFGAGGFDIARLSAGGVVAAVDAVVEGRVDNAYALVRPPGHHAVPDGGMGFCILSNIGIAAHHARAAHGLSRIAVVDWDVHHGNGTQAVFWTDPGVLTLSLHQNGCFPQTEGFVTERGGGDGFGCNLNIPLPPGSGHGAYTAAFDRVVLPALQAYRPELILVACGFDSGGWDPLGRMMTHSGTFRAMTRKLIDLAGPLCGGRVVLAHEGGYSAPTVPFMALSVIEELSGLSGGIDDPFLPFIAGLAEQELQPHQDAVIRTAETLLADIP